MEVLVVRGHDFQKTWGRGREMGAEMGRGEVGGEGREEESGLEGYGKEGGRKRVVWRDMAKSERQGRRGGLCGGWGRERERQIELEREAERERERERNKERERQRERERETNRKIDRDWKGGKRREAEVGRVDGEESGGRGNATSTGTGVVRRQVQDGAMLNGVSIVQNKRSLAARIDGSQSYRAVNRNGLLEQARVEAQSGTKGGMYGWMDE
jgi:hypothetical protein